jgi:hypothetical protein
LAQAQELLTGSTFTEYLVMLGSTLFPWLAAWESTEKSLPDKKNGKHMPPKLWWQKKTISTTTN